MAGTIMSTGQITLVDLTDERVSSFYLQANQSKIQVYDVDGKTYSPDYSTSPNLIITPRFFFGNEDNTNKLTSHNLVYRVNGVVVPTENNTLIIKNNIGSGEAPYNTETLKITATIIENTVTDDVTGIQIASSLSADIDFAKVNTGNGIIKVEQQYITSADPENPPAQNNEKWSTNNPAWVKDTYLWIRTKITYSNGDIKYTEPYSDSSWKAAADGVAGLNKEIEDINAAMSKMQAEIDGAIETWYLPGDPTDENFENPWKAEEGDTTEVREKHIGDLYFDTDTGKSYRYFKEGDEYKWQIISDEALTDAIANINALRTDVDNKVKIFYGNDTPTNPRTDDMWIKDDGSFWQYTGTQWILSSYSIETVEVQYAEHNSNSNPPEGTEFGPSSPEWKAGVYIWQRTKTTYKGGVKEPDYSNPVCISAAAARGITISGEQVFKSTDGTNYLPQSITLSTNLIGGLTVGEWYYKNGTDWVPLNSTASFLSIAYNHIAFGTGSVATIKVTSKEDASYFDVISLYKVTDGQKGADGTPTSSVFLTNENITFAANFMGEIAAKTVTCNVVAYTGTEKVTPKIGIISGAPTGMTVEGGTASNNEIPITITVDANSTLGGSGEQSGVINIPITSPISTTLKINWSKVNTGATGAAGADAIFAVVESNGKTIFADSDSNPITLTAKLYIGGEVASDDIVNYAWTSIPEGKTGDTKQLVINRDDVPSASTFICTITYNGKPYKDQIAISDKSDPIYCVIESTNGDKFTNGVIETSLTCRIFNGKGEITSSEYQNYHYTWQKYDSNGDKDENWTREDVRTIAITQDDVDAKATFSCIVTKGS